MPDSQVTLRTVLTIGVGVVLLLAVVTAVLHAAVAITLCCTALLIALALDHAVQFLVRKRVKRPLAIVIVTVLFLGLVVGAVAILIPPVLQQGKELIKHAPDYVQNIQHTALFRRLDLRFNVAERLRNLEEDSTNLVTGAAAPLLAALGGVLSFAGAVVTVFFLTIFMLVYGGRVVMAIVKELPVAHRNTYRILMEKVYQSIGGYIAGLAVICGMNATFTTIFLAINRVPFFLPLGILSGLSSTVPYVGPFVTGAVISLLAFLTVGSFHGTATVIYLLVYGQIEGNVLAPLIFRRAVRVNPLLVTLSILFLGEIGGIPGAVLAVPAVATLQIIARELLALRGQRLPVSQNHEH